MRKTTAIDLTGRRFGRLLAVNSDRNAKGQRCWACKCDCGEDSVVLTSRLTSGHTTSCGCLRREVSKHSATKNKTHGMTRTPTWRSWQAMKYRCNDKKNEDYGGRGITYCPTWDSFENFLRDMGERPEGTTLERRDPNGNYEQSNCRWATPKEQQRNRRRTRYLIVGDKSVSLMQVAEELGIKKTAIQAFFSVAIKLKEHYGTLPTP